MRRPSLATQIGLAFAAVAAVTALITALFVYFAWQREFESYVNQRVRSDASVLAELASNAYIYGEWQPQGLAGLMRLAARNGLRVQVLDTKGKLLADNANLFVGVNMPGGMTGMMGGQGVSGRTPMTEPVVREPVYWSDQQIGSLRVASASPGGFLTQQDIQFRTAALGGVALAAVLAVVLAAVGGFAYSRIFSAPIGRVTRTAAALRSGKHDARTGMGGEDEVGVLAHTLDEMADAIEAEREFERRLTADVAHELRTPLQAVQATVEAMQDGVLPADGEHLQVVRDETLRLARLADSILELSRLENRSLEFHMEPLDVAEPLRRALDTHRALMESVGLALVEDVADGLTVTGDPDRLTQAFSSLLSNAAHYTPEGGTVTVRCFAEGDQAVVSVVDTGIGISEEDRERVFTRFWRSDEARERSRKGFGVGLAIVKEIVEQHGGSVEARGNVPAVGSEFVVRLPLELAGREATPGS